MAKITWQPGTMLAPLPPALITSGDMEHPNVMTAAWTGIICSDPVITYVSLRPSRYTHELVTQNKEFVINLPTWHHAEAVDMVGVKSGRDCDKFALTGLTAEASTQVKAPQIAQCPVSIECKVLEVRPFGSHDMFLAEVVAVNVDDQYIDETGALDLEKAGLIAYAHGFYYTLGRKLGKFGFSVEKKKKKPAALSIATVIKADEKFGNDKPEEKFRKAVEDETFTENGVEVIVKKTRVKKPEKPKFESKREYKPRRRDDDGYKPREDRPYKRRDDDGYKPREDRPYKRRDDDGYKKPREDRPYKRRDDDGYKPREDRPYKRRDDDGYKPREDRPYKRRDDDGYKPRSSNDEHKPYSRDSERKPYAPRGSGKFSRKDNKSTNYEPYSFKKKSDGSFKKSAPRRPRS